VLANTGAEGCLEEPRLLQRSWGTCWAGCTTAWSGSRSSELSSSFLCRHLEREQSSIEESVVHPKGSRFQGMGATRSRLEGSEVAALQGGCSWPCLCHRRLFRRWQTPPLVLTLLWSYLMYILLVFLLCRTAVVLPCTQGPRDTQRKGISSHLDLTAFYFSSSCILPSIPSPLKTEKSITYILLPPLCKKQLLDKTALPGMHQRRAPAREGLQFPFAQQVSSPMSLQTRGSVSRVRCW